MPISLNIYSLKETKRLLMNHFSKVDRKKATLQRALNPVMMKLLLVIWMKLVLMESMNQEIALGAGAAKPKLNMKFTTKKRRLLKSMHRFSTFSR